MLQGWEGGGTRGGIMWQCLLWWCCRLLWKVGTQDTGTLSTIWQHFMFILVWYYLIFILNLSIYLLFILNQKDSQSQNYHNIISVKHSVIFIKHTNLTDSSFIYHFQQTQPLNTTGAAVIQFVIGSVHIFPVLGVVVFIVTIYSIFSYSCFKI